MSNPSNATPSQLLPEDESVEIASAKRVIGLDQIGIALSALCLVHCMLTPVLLLLLPVAGTLVRDEWFHGIMLFFLLPVAAFAFVAGVRQHHNRWVLALGLVGVVLIILGTLEPQNSFAGLEHGAVPTIIGSFFLVGAHLINRRLCRSVCQPRAQAQNCCYHES